MSRILKFIAVVSLFGMICGQDTSCQWTSPNGETFDLSPLTNNEADYRIPYAPPDLNKNIWINVCRPLLNDLCGLAVAGCQQWNPNANGGKASIGQFPSQMFSWGEQFNGNNGLILSYSNGTSDRNMQIDFICDPDTKIGKPMFVAEQPIQTYYFAWNTTLACGSSF